MVDIVGFERDARHLFRHLNDPRALRENSLADSYFQKKFDERRSDSETLLELRAGILAAARICHARSVASGRAHQADRALAIIVGLCQGRSPKQLAADLGISLPQFYRDRRTAIVDTVRIFASRPGQFSVIDVGAEARRVQLFRIWTLGDQGLWQRAVIEAEALLRSANEVHDKIAGLCEYSYAQCELGNLSAARESCLAARASLRESTSEGHPAFSSELKVRWAEYSLASVADDPESAYGIISGAMPYIERVRRGTPETDTLVLKVLVNGCHAGVLAGKPEFAQKAVQIATVISQQTYTRPEIRCQIQFMRYFANQMDSSPAERQELLTSLAQTAQREGSVAGLLMASLGLVDHWVAVGQEHRARGHAELAYSIARSMDGPHILAIVADALVQALLRTSQGEFAARLLDEVFFPATDYHALRTSIYRGQLLLVSGNYQQSARLLIECKKEAERLGQPRSLALLLPDLATAQWKCGLKKHAKETAREAAWAAPIFGSASMIRVAREMAGAIPV